MPPIAALRATVLGAAFIAAALCGWYVRGLVAQADMAEFKDGLRAQQDDQRVLKAKVEAADTVNTQESTVRIDAARVEQQKEIQYVDREVVRYVRSPDNGRCTLPLDWVRLYNETAGVPGRMPEAGAARPQAAGASSGAAGDSVPSQRR